MTTLRRRLREDRQLRGLAPKPQPCSLAAVPQLAQPSRRPPAQRRDAEWRQDFRCWLQEQQVAERTCRLHLSGRRFCSARPLKRPWPVCDRVRPRPRQQRPVVWSQREVRSLLALVEPPTARRCLPLSDACGRRLTAGPPRPVADLEAPRRLGRGRQGNGGTDRLVPLAPRGLEVWRASWQRQRPRPWVCPAQDGSAPLSPTARHKTFNAVVRQRGLPNEASIPTLRHATATPL
jgi:integrase